MGQERGVLVAKIFDRVGILADPLVHGPVEMRPVPLVVVAVLPLLQREERLVGIEGLDLQVPIVLFAVGLEELKTLGEGPRLWCQVFLVHVLPVDPVLTHDPAVVLRNLGVRDLALPGIALLATHVDPARIAVVIGGTAVLPVVIVVGDEVGVDPVLLQDREGGVVERLERAPGAVQEVVPAGVQLAPGGHARHGTDVVVVERDRAFAETHEVGRQGPVATVVRQHVPVQRVVHDHDGLHGGLLLIAWGQLSLVSVSSSDALGTFNSASFAAMSSAAVATLTFRSMARIVPSAPM